MRGSQGRAVITYRPDLAIINLDQLPRGTAAKYLECLRGPGETLIAKCWRRSIPMQRYEVIVVFPGHLRRTKL